MEELVEGRIVHFVLSRKEDETTIYEIVCRPAIIVNAWNGKLGDGLINLLIFHDGVNDIKDRNYTNIDLVTWKTSVKYSESKEIETWHWPERS